MASSFQMTCIRKNFLFLLTGVGKGVFNIFVGTVLFLDQDDLLFTIMGWAMILSGIIFVFLSKVKNMTDEDLDRALSIYSDGKTKKNLQKGAVNLAKNNKGSIQKFAKDN